MRNKTLTVIEREMTAKPDKSDWNFRPMKAKFYVDWENKVYARVRNAGSFFSPVARIYNTPAKLTEAKIEIGRNGTDCERVEFPAKAKMSDILKKVEDILAKKFEENGFKLIIK